MTEYGVTMAGFAEKTYAAIFADLSTEARALFGADIDLTETSPLGQILRVVAAAIVEVWEVAEDAYYAGFITSATGASLDEAVRIVGISRTAAVAATGTVQFSRTTPTPAAILIPAGTRVQTVGGQQAFITTEAVIMQTGSSSVTAPVVCTEPGIAGNVAAGSISSLASILQGIESITNPAPTSGGGDAETDAALRFRATTYVPGSRATTTAIRAALLGVPGVTAVNLSEDYETNTITAAVAGGDDTALLDVLEQCRPAGIAAVLARPETVAVAVTVAATIRAGYTPAAVQTAIEASLQAYFDTLAIGDPVTFTGLVGAAISPAGVQDVTGLSATDGITSIDAFGENIMVTPTEVAVAGTLTVTVT